MSPRPAGSAVASAATAARAGPDRAAAAGGRGGRGSRGRPGGHERRGSHVLRTASLRVNLGGTLLLSVMLFLTVYPLLMLLYGSLRSAAPGLPGALTLAGYADAY